MHNSQWISTPWDGSTNRASNSSTQIVDLQPKAKAKDFVHLWVLVLDNLEGGREGGRAEKTCKIQDCQLIPFHMC